MLLTFQKTAGLASLELVECIGQLDPGLATQYLSLYQSCEASQYLEHLMMRALVDPSVSQQSALLHQWHNIMKTDITTNASRGPVLTTLLNSLQENSLVSQNTHNITSLYPTYRF